MTLETPPPGGRSRPGTTDRNDLETEVVLVPSGGSRRGKRERATALFGVGHSENDLRERPSVQISEQGSNAWGDGFCDAVAWCEDASPSAEQVRNEAIALPALDDEWLVNYQAGWCAGVEAWLEGAW